MEQTPRGNQVREKSCRSDLLNSIRKARHQIPQQKVPRKLGLFKKHRNAKQ